MTNETDFTDADIDYGEGELVDQGILVSLLRAYVEARAERDNYNKRVEALAKMMKEFLVSHPGEVLYDGEHKIEARLQERSGGVTYDLISIHKADPILFQRLFDTGCLTVDAAVVKAQKDQIGGLAKYEMPKRGTTALIVERKSE